jgi:hypothetical protein
MGHCNYDQRQTGTDFYTVLLQTDCQSRLYFDILKLKHAPFIRKKSVVLKSENLKNRTVDALQQFKIIDCKVGYVSTFPELRLRLARGYPY